MQRLSILLLVAALLAPVGCRREGAQANVPHPRIVTFSPALTRMTFDMGLGDHVVGVTSYCRLPAGQTRPIVGDALNVRVEPILTVKPDIMLVQMDLSYFEPLRRIDPEVRIEHFTIEKLQDIADALERIGKLTGNPELGRQRKEDFLHKLEALRRVTAKLSPVPTLFVLGYQSVSAPGTDTFIDEMITLAGGRNVLAGEFKGWKKPSLESIIKLAPQVIVCQCKPEDEAEARAYWQALHLGSASPQRVITVTDDDWTLPADQLADYTSVLSGFIHPELKDARP